MWEDQEILHEVWEGKLPVCFTLAPDEVTSFESPRPFYLLLPRVNYFPVILEKVQRYFVSFISEDQVDDMWLDYDGIPLKWHYPIGVLFDIYAYGKEQLPWQITVHFKHFPEDIVMRCRVKEAIQAHYMQTVKEADQLKHRGEVINSMQKQDHRQLWAGLSNDRYEQFWTINRRLMESTNDNPLRYVPFRLYPPLQDPKASLVPIQRLCKPLTEAGERSTLLDLITEWSPEFSDAEQWTIISHGIPVPFDTPMSWLCVNFAYPDNFVHLSIKRVDPNPVF